MKRRNAEQVGDILNRFLRQEGLETPLNQYRLIAAWTEVMGQSIARYTGEVFIKNDILYVKIKSAALKSNLMMERKKLARRLNEHVGSQVVTDIAFF